MIPRRGKSSPPALVDVELEEPEEPEEPVDVPDVVPVVVLPLEPEVVPVVVPLLEPEVEPVVVPLLEPEVVPVVVPLLEPDVVPVVVPLLEPDVVPVAVPLLVPDVVLPEVPVEDVPVALELVPVSAAVVGAAESAPESPPPQPASAIDTLLNSAGQITRPDPNPRLAFLMRSPKKRLHCRPGRTKSFIQRRCTRGHGNAWVAGGFSRGSASAPATPLS